MNPLIELFCISISSISASLVCWILILFNPALILLNPVVGLLFLYPVYKKVQEKDDGNIDIIWNY